VNARCPRSLTFLDSFFIPTRRLAVEIKLHYRRKPARCQRTTMGSRVGDLLSPTYDAGLPDSRPLAKFRFSLRTSRVVLHIANVDADVRYQLGTFATSDSVLSIAFDGANIWLTNTNLPSVSKMRASAAGDTRAPTISELARRLAQTVGAPGKDRNVTIRSPAPGIDLRTLTWADLSRVARYRNSDRGDANENSSYGAVPCALHFGIVRSKRAGLEFRDRRTGDYLLRRRWPKW